MESWEQITLLKFSQDPKDFWTVDDAVKGTSIIGGTGSGKTTGSGKAIALKFLEQGWGGLVLCAKKDEAKLWRQYCEKAGRENDLIIFGKNSLHAEGEHKGKPIVFNPLNYEMTRSGEGAGEAFNISNIFMNIYRMGNRASNDGETRKETMFWDNALKRILNRTIELINFAGEELTFRNMIDLIYSAPTEKSPLDDTLFDNFTQMVKYEEDNLPILNSNIFLKCLAKGCNKINPDDTESQDFRSYNDIYNYFVSSLPNMSEHTHNAIIESFMGIVDPFLSGILNKHFSGKTNLYPEDIFTHNKIIVLDFPIKEYLEVGVIAQSIFKLIFQQAVERRDVEKHPNPVFLWSDEAHYFVTAYDQLFLTTARSARVATVFLSQSISNYFAVMGAGQDARAKVDSLMGNLTTKIFHANSDAETNEYASRLIGKTIALMGNKGSSQSFINFNFQQSEGISEQYLPQIQPREFTMLKSGGKNNDYQVDSVVFVTGKKWSTDTNYLKTSFKQIFTS